MLKNITVALLLIFAVGGVWYFYSQTRQVVATPPADAVATTVANITGKWQSTDDSKFVREFNTDDTYTDSYDNEADSSGRWIVFTEKDAPKAFPYPMDSDAVYLQLTLAGEQTETLNFKVSTLTTDTLQLIYLDRGGALNFTRVQ